MTSTVEIKIAQVEDDFTTVTSYGIVEKAIAEEKKAWSKDWDASLARALEQVTNGEGIKFETGDDFLNALDKN